MMGLETLHWHTLHASFLDENSLVLDLGANYGLFSKKIVERFGCRCHAVEPSPEVFTQMYSHERITKSNLAIAPANGTAMFRVEVDSTASKIVDRAPHEPATISIPTRRLEDLVADLAWERVDLLKMDIEGAEIEVLNSCSDDFLRSVRQMTIEFHDFCGLTRRRDVLMVLERLGSLGFLHIRVSRVGHQNTWLINRRLCPISWPAFIWGRYIWRNWFGFRVLAGRLLCGRTAL